MDTLSYILIGILQGILEWLPVSSKGVEALIGQVLQQNPFGSPCACIMAPYRHFAGCPGLLQDRNP